MDENFDFLLDDMGPSIPDIESICLNCGLEETIPDFIYDEMGGKSKHKELKTKKKVSTLDCNRCGKFKTVSKYWLNHELISKIITNGCKIIASICIIY